MPQDNLDSQYEAPLDFAGRALDTFPWSASDLPAIWEHMLRTNVIAVIAALDPLQAIKLSQQCTQLEKRLGTIAALVGDAESSKEAINVLADLTNRHLTNPEPTIPPVIAMVMHNVATLLLRRTSGVARSDVSDKELVKRADWLISLPWLDDATRAVCQDISQMLPPPTD